MNFMKHQSKKITLHTSHLEEALIPYLKTYFGGAIEAVDLNQPESIEVTVYYSNKKENDVKEITFESEPAPVG
jgi:hypothetical protein